MFKQDSVVDIVEFRELASQNLDKTVTNIVQLCKERAYHIATAESCTGGMLSSILTSISGASSVFEVGICCYANRIKESVLYVPNDQLTNCGAVSPEVCDSMLLGLHKISQADIGIAVTGIAGPTGGSQEKPVGTVYVGIEFCGTHFLYHVRAYHAKSREEIRMLTTRFAFARVEEMLMEEEVLR